MSQHPVSSKYEKLGGWCVLDLSPKINVLFEGTKIATEKLWAKWCGVVRFAGIRYIKPGGELQTSVLLPHQFPVSGQLVRRPELASKVRS
jgi:hypothetical protein